MKKNNVTCLQLCRAGINTPRVLRCVWWLYSSTDCSIKYIFLSLSLDTHPPRQQSNNPLQIFHQWIVYSCMLSVEQPLRWSKQMTGSAELGIQMYFAELTVHFLAMRVCLLAFGLASYHTCLFGGIHSVDVDFILWVPPPSLDRWDKQPFLCIKNPLSSAR